MHRRVQEAVPLFFQRFDSRGNPLRTEGMLLLAQMRAKLRVEARSGFQKVGSGVLPGRLRCASQGANVLVTQRFPQNLVQRLHLHLRQGFVRVAYTSTL